MVSIINNDLSIPSSKEEMLRKPNFTGWNFANFCENTGRGGVEQFMPIFGSMLGGSAAEIGVMSGVYSLINIFQLVWAFISAKLSKLKVFVLIGWIISSILFIPMILLRKGQMLMLIIIRFIQGFFYSAYPPAQGSLLAEHIPLQERAAKINNFTRIGLLGAFLGTLIGGLIFSLSSDIFDLRTEETFILLFLWSMLLGLFASMMFYTSVPDYTHYDRFDSSLLIHHHVIHMTSPSRLNLFDKIKAYHQKFSNFWRFCIFASLFYFAVNLAGPFFVILTIEFYNLSFFATAVLTSISTLVQFLINLYMTKTQILDRFGRKFPLLIGLIIVSGATFSVVVPYYIDIPIFEWCFVTWVLLGIGWGVFNASLTVFLLDLVHPQYRMPLIASYNSVTGLIMFIGSIGGGIIVDVFSNITLVFILRTFLILFSLGLLYKVQEPEMPGIITHPFKYLFVKYTRLGTERGSAVTFLPVWLRKLSVRNLFSSKRRKKGPSQN